MSTELPEEPASRDLKARTMPSTKASKSDTEEASTWDSGEKSLTPQKLPKGGTYQPSTTTEVPTRETFLAKSIRKLGSVLRLSIISKSFKSKSYLAQMRGKLEAGWSDIVDHVIESDSDSESFDSYLDFMHGRFRGKKGRSNSFRRKLWLVRKRDEEARSLQAEQDDENGGRNTEQFVPWFEESS